MLEELNIVWIFLQDQPSELLLRGKGALGGTYPIVALLIPLRTMVVSQTSKSVLLTTGNAVAEKNVNIFVCFRIANYWD